MDKKRKCSLKAADGAILVADARPVSPFSLKGMGRGLAGAYGSVRGATTDAIEAVAKPFARPPGYTPALQAAPAPVAPAAVVAPVAPVEPAPTVAGAVNAIQQRQQMLNGLRDGSPFVRGKGGPIDDTVDAKLSVGEAVLPADTVEEIGPENIEALIDATHTPAALQKKGMPPGGRHRGLRDGMHAADGFIPGMEVRETPFTEADARMFGRRPAGTVTGSASIPGMEVREGLATRPGPTPTIPGMRVEYPITDPGPGNPNVGKGAARPAPAMPTAAAEPAPVAGRATGLRGFFSGGATDVPGAVRSVASGAGTLAKNVARGNAALAAPVAAATGFTTDTEDYAKRFGLEDTQPGVLRDVGIRAMGLASDVGNAMGFGVPGMMFRDKQEAAAAPAAAPVAAPATAAAPQPAQRGPAPPLDNTVIPGGAQAAKVAGTVQRRGNSFTNTGAFAEDLAPGGISQQNDAAAAALDARERARTAVSLRGGLDENLPAGAGVTLPESQSERERIERNAGVRSTFADAGLSDRQRSIRDTALRNDATQRELAAQRDATERRGQDITNEGFARRDKVTLRGQDLEYGAATQRTAATMATAAADAQRQQRNADRQYNLEVQKFGVDAAEKNRAARSASDEAFRKSMETRFRTPDGQVDNGKVAAFSTALSATLPRMIEQLEATGKPEAAAKARALRERGVAAMEPGDLDGMQRLFDTRERMRGSRGMGPNQASFVESDNLMDYRQAGLERRTFGGDRVVTAGGGSISENDLAYTEPANAILPDWFKTRSNNLNRGLRLE